MQPRLGGLLQYMLPLFHNDASVNLQYPINTSICSVQMEERQQRNDRTGSVLQQHSEKVRSRMHA